MARNMEPILQKELQLFYDELLEGLVRGEDNENRVSVAMLKKLYPLKMTERIHPYAYLEREKGNDKSLTHYFPKFPARFPEMSGWRKVFYHMEEGCEDAAEVEWGDDIDENGEITMKLSQQNGINSYIQIIGGGKPNPSYFVWKTVFIPQWDKHYICVINMTDNPLTASRYWVNIYHLKDSSCITIKNELSLSDPEDYQSFFYYPISTLSTTITHPIINWNGVPWGDEK